MVSAIIIILAAAAMPLAKVTATRQREAELRRALREMRTAIDKFKDGADLGQISPLEIKAGSEGYPQTSRRWSKACPQRTMSPAARSSSFGGFRSIR